MGNYFFGQPVNNLLGESMPTESVHIRTLYEGSSKITSYNRFIAMFLDEGEKNCGELPFWATCIRSTGRKYGNKFHVCSLHTSMGSVPFSKPVYFLTEQF